MTVHLRRVIRVISKLFEIQHSAKTRIQDSCQFSQEWASRQFQSVVRPCNAHRFKEMPKSDIMWRTSVLNVYGHESTENGWTGLAFMEGWLGKLSKKMTLILGLQSCIWISYKTSGEICLLEWWNQGGAVSIHVTFFGENQIQFITTNAPYQLWRIMIEEWWFVIVLHPQDFAVFETMMNV